jgi:hypothetical protein
MAQHRQATSAGLCPGPLAPRVQVTLASPWPGASSVPTIFLSTGPTVGHGTGGVKPVVCPRPFHGPTICAMPSDLCLPFSCYILPYISSPSALLLSNRRCGMGSRSWNSRGLGPFRMFDIRGCWTHREHWTRQRHPATREFSSSTKSGLWVTIADKPPSPHVCFGNN